MIAIGYVARFFPLLALAFTALLAQVPSDCEEAIWVDGGGTWTTFVHYIIPASLRAAAALVILAFVLCFGELATTILVSPPGVQTLAVRLFTIEANAPRADTANLALLMMAGCVVPTAVGLAAWSIVRRTAAYRPQPAQAER
jgi:iron(III) transport system permease protein